MHDVAPVLDACPAEQSVQEVPAVVENWPAGQGKQPKAGLAYCPAEQERHPGHPAWEYEPLGQGRHEEEPIGAYVPAEQVEHMDDPPGEAVPT